MNSQVAVRTTVELAGKHHTMDAVAIHPAGTLGAIVRTLSADAFLVELRIEDDALVGGAWYPVFELRAGEFEQIEDVKPSC